MRKLRKYNVCFYYMEFQNIFLPNNDATLLDNNGLQDALVELSRSKIHIRLKQRNGRKTITSIENLVEYVDSKSMKKLASIFRKSLNTRATLKTDENDNKIIELSGDKRNGVSDYIISKDIAKKKDIVIHGY